MFSPSRPPSSWSPDFYVNNLNVIRNGDSLESHCCFTGDTKISLLDGTEVSLLSLIDKKEFYVHAFDRNTNKIVTARGHSARLTRKNMPILKVILDTGDEIRCTPDHKFMDKKGRYIEAQYLEPGYSLMTLYKHFKSENDHLDYGEILQSNGNWDFTHRLVYNYKYGEAIKKKPITHHKVKNIEFVGYDDVYCITVDKYHNFALSAGVFVKNCGPVCHDGIYVGSTSYYVNNKDIQYESHPIDCGSTVASHSPDFTVD